MKPNIYRIAVFSALLATAMLAPDTSGSETQSGGYLIGNDYVYTIATIDGWLADSKSGAQNGLQLVLYPAGDSWASTKTIVYGRSVPNARSDNLEGHINTTVEKYLREGSPNYVSKKISSLNMPDGRIAPVYSFSGDKWGNHEAAVYFQEEHTLNYLVFASKEKALFDKLLDDFLQIAATYENRYAPENALSSKNFDEWEAMAWEQQQTEAGEAYQNAALQAQGQYMRNALMACTARVDSEDGSEIHYFARITQTGTTASSSVYPASRLALCFNGFLSKSTFPEHELGSYLLHLPIVIKQ